MQNWNKIIKTTSIIEEIGEQLDRLSHSERVEAVRTMTGASQALLWEMAEGTEVTLEDMVPTEVPPLTPVIHFGKNSLPVLSNFEKRFCRPNDGTDLLYGYNEGLTRPLVGPGYFVVRKTGSPSKGTIVVDYFGKPTEKPASWPEIQPTDHGVPALVYGFMHDYLRKVSSHVTIGRAYKFHKVTNNYFLLCRDEI